MEITLSPNSTLTLPQLRNKQALNGTAFPISGDAKHRPLSTGELTELAKTGAYLHPEQQAALTLGQLQANIRRFKITQQPQDLTATIDGLEQLELDLGL